MSGTKEHSSGDLAPLRTEAAASQRRRAVRPDGEKPDILTRSMCPGGGSALKK